MKPLQVYVDETQLKTIKLEAIEKGVSVAELVREYLPGGVVREVIELSPEEEVPVTKLERELNPTTKFCKHGSPMGLCKFSCKK